MASLPVPSLTSAGALLASLSRRPQPAVLIVAAHPDDETVGAGGLLLELRRCWLAHVTDGAPRNLYDARAHGLPTREAYAEVRRQELASALSLAGKGCGYALNVADQEAALDLMGLTLRLLGVMRQLNPDLILTHPYEGGHPDHDATAFAVHAARALLRVSSSRGHPALRRPLLVEFTSYHGRYGTLTTGEFLAGPNRVWILPLPSSVQATKRRMLAAFRTQRAVLAPFSRIEERFRLAPRYHFAAPPHGGALYYERFPWGMTRQRWCRLTAGALARLGLQGPL